MSIRIKTVSRPQPDVADGGVKKYYASLVHVSVSKKGERDFYFRRPLAEHFETRKIYKSQWLAN
jgi:hypothetical protein